MKIVKVSTHVMGVVLPRQKVDAARRNWIFVRIETDEGITGLGEATTEHCEHAVVAMIEKHFGPYLIPPRSIVPGRKCSGCSGGEVESSSPAPSAASSRRCGTSQGRPTGSRFTNYWAEPYVTG